MQKLIITVGVFFCVASCIAQNPRIPQQNQPNPENLRVLMPPDLRVEELSFVSIIRKPDIKKMNIQVLIRIKNYGELRSGESSALAYIKSPASATSIQTLETAFQIPSINPGASFVKVFTFQEAVGLFRAGTFNFWIKADARNTVTESNESNNTSTVLSIETPAVR